MAHAESILAAGVSGPRDVYGPFNKSCHPAWLGGHFSGISQARSMNSMKLVIPLHSLYWSIHTKDESKRGTAFAFIFGVN